MAPAGPLARPPAPPRAARCRLAVALQLLRQAGHRRPGPAACPAAGAAPLSRPNARPRAAPGAQRALQLIALGLRSEGVREWNFSLRGMPERELLAAAQWPASARSGTAASTPANAPAARSTCAPAFPARRTATMLRRVASQPGTDPALVYGLIRQESRFITDARSSVGAVGPDAADAGHRALDGAAHRPALQGFDDQRPRRQPAAGRQLPEAACSTTSAAPRPWPPPPTTPAPAARAAGAKARRWRQRRRGPRPSPSTKPATT